MKDTDIKDSSYLAKVMDLRIQIKAHQLWWDLDLVLTQKNINTLNFYKFCKKFFQIWEKYFNRILPLLHEYTQKENVRSAYSEVLYIQYNKYLKELENLEIPHFLTYSFNHFMDSLYRRREYFRINSGSGLRLLEISNYSDENEYLLWKQLYALSEKMFTNDAVQETETPYQKISA